MFLNDRETATDLLYYEAIARTVVRFIRETSVAPITIGVHGDWGAGKSSVLKMTEAAFKDEKRVLCLWFNGWVFEGFEDAKTVVIETIVEELRRARPASTKVADAAKKVLRRVDWLKMAHRAGGLVLTAATGIPTLDQVRGVVDTVTSFLAKPQDHISVEDLKDVAAHAKEFVKDASEEADRLPAHMHEFRKEFEELLQAAELDRLVVIVDDLDRCLPKTAIATLEAIRLFLMVDRTAFVIGADELMIEYAVKEHFPDLPPSTGPVSYPRNYLEKLIQVPFRVPALGVAETRVYITLLLAELALTSEDARFKKLLQVAREDMKRPWQSRGLDARAVAEAVGEPVPTEVRQAQLISTHLTRLLTEGTHGNPRQIKRFLNSMMLRQAIAEERGFGGDVKLIILGKIMLAERFYPDFYKQLAQLATAEGGKPEALAQFEESIKKSREERVVEAQTSEAAPESVGKKSSTKAAVPKAQAPEVGDWSKNEWIKGWAAIEPPLAGVDLLPYVFVTRDKRGSLGGITASAHLESLVARLMGGKMTARGCVTDVANLSPQEVDEVFNAVSDQILQTDDMRSEPKGMHGLLVLSERGPETGRRALEFAKSLDVSKIGIWALNLVAGIKDAALVNDVNALRKSWGDQDENPQLKKAVTLMESLGKKN
jgi:hypothetical protein